MLVKSNRSGGSRDSVCSAFDFGGGGWDCVDDVLATFSSISIENRSSPVHRIVSFQASLSCNYDADYKPIYRAVRLHDIIVAHCSYRCVPVGILEASSTFWPIARSSWLSIQNRLPPVDRIVPLQVRLSCNFYAAIEPN